MLNRIDNNGNPLWSLSYDGPDSTASYGLGAFYDLQTMFTSNGLPNGFVVVGVLQELGNFPARLCPPNARASG